MAKVQEKIDIIMTAFTNLTGNWRHQALKGNRTTPPTAKYIYGFKNAADIVLSDDQSVNAVDKFAQAITKLADLSAEYRTIGPFVKVCVNSFFFFNFSKLMQIQLLNFHFSS